MRRGFNLVEAAVVLGIIGLVIGGIWVAASSITQNMRINETAMGILTTINNSRKLFPLAAYPTSNGDSVQIGTTLNAANGYPPGFSAFGNHAISPLGARIEAALACYADCPKLGVKFYGPGSVVYPSEVTAAECRQLVARFGSLIKDNSDFIYVQIQTLSNAVYQTLYPPFTFADVDCPADFSQVFFWFKP